MGRGTPDVLTAWIPFGDIPLRAGGLMVLEDSHRTSQQRLADYLRQDVDSYCENGPNADARPDRRDEVGALARPDRLERRDHRGRAPAGAGLETRWLTADYRMGDVLVFTLRTVHAGTDNEIDPLRLSTDSRYQPANQPIDPRWIGEEPIGHGLEAKQGRIC